MGKQRNGGTAAAICGSTVWAVIFAATTATAQTTTARTTAAKTEQRNAAEETCRFESGPNGFAGHGGVVQGLGVEGSACWKVENTANDGAQSTKLLHGGERDLQRLTLKIRPTKLQRITVRFLDAQGQTFQNSHALKPDQWQSLEIGDLTAGQSWGGPADGVWRGPCERIDFLIEEKAGAALIDDVVLAFQPEVAPAAAERKARRAKAKAWDVASFNAGLDAFDGGSLERRTDKPAEGQGYARMKNVDQDFVDMARSLDARRDFVEFRFRARSTTAGQVAVRFQDATGQEFLHRFPIPRDGGWHEYVVHRFAPGEQSWGGADDKQWHPPCKGLAFVLEERRAEVDLDAVQAWLDESRVVADFDWTAPQPSHVFFTSETPAIPFETRGDRVDFRVADFWGKEAAAAEVKPVGGQAAFQPPARNGYFLVRARASLEGKQIAERYTSYAVIDPFEPGDPASSPWGVATHFAQGMTPHMLPVLRKAGLGMIRDEMYWEDVEQERGKYAFSHRFRNYMQAVQQAGMAPLIIMDFANPLYDDGLTPWTDAGCDAFGAYGQAVQAQFPGQVRWLEVWNEYNGTWCEGPAALDRPKSHVKLLRHAYQKIKQTSPQTQVLGGAAVLLPRPYLEGVFEHGGLKYMDGLVIHPYRDRPEGVDDEVEELRGLMRKHNQGVEKDIWVTETGLQAEQEFDWEKGRNMYERGRAEAARYLPRQYALLLKAGCKRIFWYVCADSDVFKTMGLLRQEKDVAGMGPLAVTPNYVACAVFIRQIDGKRFAQREAFTPYSRAYCLRFTPEPLKAEPLKPGLTKPESPKTGRASHAGDVRVCWSTVPSAFELSADGPIQVVDLMGGRKTLQPVQGKVRLPLGLDAVYLLGPITHVEEVADGPPCVAATFEDYSDQQGNKGWRYGYRQGLNGLFQEMTWRKTEWEYRWGADGFAYLQQSREGGEPEGTAEAPCYLDRRWRCAADGSFALDGEFGSTNPQSDGLDVHVLVDGRKVFSEVVPGGRTVSRRIPFQARAGDAVDILVGPHRQSSYDACLINFRILRTDK